ncbi:divisome protein SepX/GlpR [Streptomyces sp. NPDC003691]
MSSSGLIYAVIVGAWAAYLVPMWLRRQDELNEARPTERFSTAIRLLSGRGAMERRYAKELLDRHPEQPDSDVDPDAVTEHLSTVDVRAFAAPRTEVRAQAPDLVAQAPRPAPRPAAPEPASDGSAPPAARRPGRRPRPRPSRAAAERARRSKVLARRRRTTVLLFLAFTAGSVVAAVGGLGFLWAPAAPAVTLSAYIAYLRAQERRRFVVVMDRRRAEAAAQRLRETRHHRHQPPAAADPHPEPAAPEPRPEPEPAPVSPQEAGRRALVEQTDHAEWVDQQRDRGPASGGSWDPVPVPLPTYVTAPVAPRATSGIDMNDPETWSSARSSPADPTPPPATAPQPPPRRTPRERGRTPLFDQYADDDRPRAANE